MKLNESTVIAGRDVYLVPYRKEHVPMYHKWMESPSIREATASELLSLDQEYDMQKSWHLDEDKLTFIILARDPSLPVEMAPTSLTKNMIGDVNLFLSPVISNDEVNDSPTSLQGELEIMIAESSAQRRGFATQALKLIINYVGLGNTGSIRLFEKLGFENVREVPMFRELEMRIRTKEHENIFIELIKQEITILQI